MYVRSVGDPAAVNTTAANTPSSSVIATSHRRCRVPTPRPITSSVAAPNPVNASLAPFAVR
jgi:hypothetical protein